MFIVVGRTGEYSDRIEWFVCYYETEAAARDHADAANRCANTLPIEAGWAWDRVDGEVSLNRWDPRWERRDADERDQYRVEEVPHGNTVRGQI